MGFITVSISSGLKDPAEEEYEFCRALRAMGKNMLSLKLTFADAGSIGVNYGRVASNLPSAMNVVQLLKSQGLERVELFDTDPAVLKVLAGSGIKVVVDLPNENLCMAAKRPSFAYAWVQKNIVAYYPATQIHTIAVRNELFVDPDNVTKYHSPAMKNVNSREETHE
ncbi:lichenase-like [Macadamia integrifolia]|uniref:lichenase-like n=1 Tax=Macadamia integrifolia TaxID=60698 RepID=UPI001C4F1AE9|nr:lichenase-like [Macadamia integrifolia]